MAEELVTIKKFDYLPEAEVARLHLEEAGIPAFIADAETGTMLLANTVGYVKLQVPRALADSAVALLEEPPTTEEATEESADSEHSEAIHCLACGAVMDEDQEVCGRCGWSYDATGKPRSDSSEAGGTELDGEA